MIKVRQTFRGIECHFDVDRNKYMIESLEALIRDCLMWGQSSTMPYVIHLIEILIKIEI